MNRVKSTVLFATIGMGVTLSLTMTGCSAPSGAPSAAPTAVATPSQTASAAPTAVAETGTFTMPTQCLDILPASRLAQFDTAKLVLLGGPGGRYGDKYLLDPTPEETAGGITCIWGFSDTEVSSITVSVAPVTPDSRAKIIDTFVANGLNESEFNGASIFGKQGDSDTTPAVINSIRASSWISVISTIGGAVNYEAARAIVAEVTAMVYTTP